MWLELTPEQRVMKGTEAKHNPHCVGLQGKIGKDAHCRIYENRPSTCRAFAASFENGVRNPRCDQARAHHGLPALRREDWPPLDVHISPCQIAKYE
jgi:Fe-S-cluster containining protein